MQPNSETNPTNENYKQSWWLQPRSLVVVAVVIVVLLCVIPLAFHLVLNSIFGTRTEPANMATVSGKANVQFPHSAKLRNSLAIHHGLDLELYTEVEIDREDVGAFVAALKKQDFRLSRKDRMHITNSIRNWREDTPVPKWWNPDSARRFITCYTCPAVLLVSMDNTNKAIIWVHSDTDRP